MHTSPVMPGAPSFLRQEPGYDYMSSDGRRGCQEKNVPEWKRRLIALSWTAVKMMLAEQEEEDVLAVKSIGIVAPGMEGTLKSPAGTRHLQPSSTATEVTSKRSHRTWRSGEQSREVAMDMAGRGAGRQLLPCQIRRDGAPPCLGSKDAHGQPCQGLRARPEAGDAGSNLTASLLAGRLV